MLLALINEDDRDHVLSTVALDDKNL